MNLWLRLLKVLSLGFLRPRLALVEESRLDFMVWPGDLDLNMHMNNARYMSLMDLGRVDIIARTGLGRLMWHRRLQPVIAGAIVRFRRPLRPFERFSLRSRVVGWDAKWLFFEHRLEREGELVCHAVAKGLFLGREGGVPTDHLVEYLGHGEPAPVLPPWILDWQALEAARNQPVFTPVEKARCAL